MRLWTLIVVCCAAASAGADVVPTQCQRNAEGYINWTSGQTTYELSDASQRPFPPYPLGILNQTANTSAPNGIFRANAQNLSTTFSDSTLMHCYVQSSVQAAPYGPGTNAILFSQAAAVLEFSVTEPVDVMIQSRLSIHRYNTTQIQQVYTAVMHDGQTVAGFGGSEGDSIQSLTLRLGNGSWAISAQCESFLNAEPSGSADLQTSISAAELDVHIVPTPASLALLALALVACARRR